LLDKYSDDLAVKRLIYVNGDAIVVPSPRVSITFSGGLAQWVEWDGTHTGDPPNSPGYNYAQNENLPLFPEAYWTAREANWPAWVAAARQLPGLSNLCPNTSGGGNGFWDGGFCMAQGHPGPGVYYSHSLIAQNLQSDPLSNLPWSLADHYFNEVGTPIPIGDPDAAIQSVIAAIQGGLPVNMGFLSIPALATSNGSGGTLDFRYNGATWYLPPELAGCSTAQLDGVLGRAGGHSVNLVGYWITGTAAAPDVVNSYFIIENNWGKTAGYRSFFFMNLAAFRYLVTSLETYRLDIECASVACATQPPSAPPSNLTSQLQYPPDPNGPNAGRYQALMAALGSTMSGTPRQSKPVNPALLH
jgi:hypothetical protein